MPSKKYTIEQLRKASDHLYYEIMMFQQLAEGLQSGISGASTIHNALLESFGIHTRALIDFFFTDQDYKDDVLAVHYFDKPEIWMTKRSKITDILNKAKTRTDKEIAHLTYTRQDVLPEEKGWDHIAIYNDLQPVIEKFYEIVQKELLTDVWPKPTDHT